MCSVCVSQHVVNMGDALLRVVIGSGEPLQSPLRPPGTDVKVGTESKGDGELPPGRWWSELTVIHTN